jgi:hypothetical protein
MRDISSEAARTTDTNSLCAGDEQQRYRRKSCLLTHGLPGFGSSCGGFIL